MIKLGIDNSNESSLKTYYTFALFIASELSACF